MCWESVLGGMRQWLLRLSKIVCNETTEIMKYELTYLNWITQFIGQQDVHNGRDKNVVGEDALRTRQERREDVRQIRFRGNARYSIGNDAIMRWFVLCVDSHGIIDHEGVERPKNLSIEGSFACIPYPIFSCCVVSFNVGLRNWVTVQSVVTCCNEESCIF